MDFGHHSTWGSPILHLDAEQTKRQIGAPIQRIDTGVDGDIFSGSIMAHRHGYRVPVLVIAYGNPVVFKGFHRPRTHFEYNIPGRDAGNMGRTGKFHRSDQEAVPGLQRHVGGNMVIDLLGGDPHPGEHDLTI